MFKLLFTILVSVAHNTRSCEQKNDPATNQIINFKNNTTGPIGIMTTEAGAPVEKRDAISTFNTDLLSNEHFVDGMTHFVRERIPERVVHAHGSGALGYFEITNDISHICKAKLFSKVGKKTPVIARFSSAFGNLGVRDTSRDLRGFAVKFYTEEGILDLIGLNTPIASVRDPVHFNHAVHAATRNPATFMPDPNALWDLLTLRTEIIFIFLYIYSDYGMPANYRHMPGFPVHTYDVYNKKGEKSYVRFHFQPKAGVKNLNATEVLQVAGGDPDYYARDLYNAIANCLYPSWTINVQILSEEDKANAGFDIYDITRILPIDKYPLHPVGTLTLNSNPKNHFSQIEQVAFTPGNIVPGILGSAGKAYEARRFVYRDAQNHRLGANYKKIPVNCPLGSLTYNRDGVPPLKGNGEDSPNYYPNSVNGPIPYEEKNRPMLSKIVEGEGDNFEQASNFYSNELNTGQQSRLVENIVASISPCEEGIKKRAVQKLKTINRDLGTKVAKGLAAKTA